MALDYGQPALAHSSSFNLNMFNLILLSLYMDAYVLLIVSLTKEYLIVTRNRSQFRLNNVKSSYLFIAFACVQFVIRCRVIEGRLTSADFF